MKLSNFKKGLLTLAAILTCGVASADTLLKENYTPDGTFILETDIDFETQSLEVVVDLSDCGYFAGQDILSVGADENVMESGYNNANALHCLYTPNSTQMQFAYFGTSRILTSMNSVAKTEHTFVLSKDGLYFDGALVEATNGNIYGTATDFGPNTLSELLVLDHIYLGSTFTALGSRSFATYKSIKVIGEAGGTEPDTPEPAAQPESIPFDLTEQGGWTANGTDKFAWSTDIDFTKQYLQVVLNLDSCTTDKENVLSVGEAIDKWDGNHIHFYYYPSEKKMQLTYKGGDTYKNYKTGIEGTDTLVFSKEGVLLNGELWTGATADGYGTADKADSTTIKQFLALTNISVGSQEGTVRSHANYLSVQLIDYPEEPDPTPDPDPEPATQPESIPFDLTEQGGWVANGEKFAWEADIDFETQTLEAVLDLSTCTGTSEGILSIGENIDLWGTSTEGNGNVIHLYYTDSNSYLKTWAFNGHAEKVNSGLTFDDSQKAVIKVTKDGWYINDELQGDATTCSGILALNHIYVGSQEGNGRSHATYLSVKILNNEPEVVVTPDTIEIPLTEAYTPSAEHNNQYIGGTKINFDEKTLKVTVDLANCTSDDQAVITIGESVSSLYAPTAGNIHVGYSPEEETVVAYYLATEADEESTAQAEIELGDATKITFELSKQNGLTAQLGDAEAATVFTAEAIAPIVALDSIEVGCIAAEQVFYGAAQATVESILVEDIPPFVVTKPEAIPFDLTEHGGWYAEGDTFAWDSDIDWKTQALEIVLDLSSCTSTANQNVVSIAGAEADLANWGAGNDANPQAGHIHFYYTKSSNNMEVDYLTSSGNIYRNSNTALFSNTEDNTMHISMDGVKVNGNLWEGAAEQTTSYTSFDATTISPLTALTHIWVGSTQGDGRSWATYKSIKLIDYSPVANGISNVEPAAEQNENAPMYNLAGQRVGKDYKGIVIVNGKKVLK